MQKRNSQRVRIAVEVTVKTSHDFYAGITGDVGCGGVFFVTEEPPAPGSSVQVEIRVPGGGLVRGEGAVRWVRTPDLAGPDRPPGCGVAWQAMDRRSVATLRRFLASRSPPRAPAEART